MIAIPLLPSESIFGVTRGIVSWLRRSMSRPLCVMTFLVAAGIQQAMAQAPVAQFTANHTSGCAPLVVTFQDQSTGNPTSWNWGISNGQLSTNQHPTITFSQPGTYSVSLVVENADGTHGITKRDYITVYPSPTPAMSSNVTIGCVPVEVQFTDMSTANAGTLTTWEWSFGDGTTSTQQNPRKTYNQTGFYTIGLRVVSSTGCEASRTWVRHIRIVPGVTAEFNNSEPVTCRGPFNINFINQTSGPGNMTWQWDFGNSATSTQQHPTTSYTDPGTYNVQLIGRSEYGCADTVVKPVTVTAYGTAIDVPDELCLNTPVNFQNGSSPGPVSALWDFGNGSESTNINDTTRYTAYGDYTVKLVNTYPNCKDSVTKTVTVLPLPTVNFTASETVSCRAPFTVNFQDLSPEAVSWLWDFGDGTTSTEQHPVHTYQAEGQYTVTLTITTAAGCTNSISTNNYIRIIKPTVRIGNVPTGGCIPFTFQPVPSVSAVDGVASWFWDYGDGFTSTADTPATHTYTEVGTFTMKLRITTNGGCTDSIVFPGAIRTGTKPVADFEMTTPDTCAAADIQFTSLSTHPDGVDNVLWVFGDGVTSEEDNPIHSFTDTGFFNVTLTAYHNACPSDPVTKPVHIKPPIADFDIEVSCTDKRTVTFVDRSKTDFDYGDITYTWQFGDPANSTSDVQGDVSFTYPALGEYDVTLTVTNGGCTHYNTQQVRLVSDIADFTISKTKVCRNEAFVLTAVNSNPSNILNYAWSLGGGPFVVSNRSIQASFPANDVYDIALRITDINGCEDTKELPNAVRVTGPTARFIANDPGACSNTPITFTDQSTSEDPITQWLWNFDDGQPAQSLTAPFVHTFADTGTYTIRLTVVDNNNCRHTYVLPDSIRITRPQAGFRSAYTTICPDVPLAFTDTSKGLVETWFWDFGDGNTSTDRHPEHSYTGDDAEYTVKLVITDSVGCKDSVIRNSYIATRRPKAAFTVTDTSTICPPIETKFTFQGQDYESFHWDFGDGNTSTLRNPSNFYNAFGSYTARLILRGYGGCYDTATANVNVYNPRANTTLTYNPLRACNELLVDFSLTWPPGTSHTLYFGDGALDTTQHTVLQHFYAQPRNYIPSILLRDSQDCQVNISGSQTIEVIGAIPLFGKDKRAFCDSGTVSFQNYTLAPNDPVRSRLWEFGDGNTSTDENPVHFYAQPGTYIVAHNITTEEGCTNVRHDTVRVYGTPHVQINGEDIVCIDEMLRLTGELITPDTAITWAWNLANGDTGNEQAVTTSYGAAGEYIVTLVTSNLLNCRDTTTKNILVPPTPEITVTENPVIPVGTGITLPVSYSENIAQYIWTPPTRLSCTDCPTPFANPVSTTTYKVTVEDIYGCQASKDITVTVVCNQENYFVPNTFSPNGDGKNDIFAPRGKGIFRVNSMKIFNRWGELIFEKRNFMANDRSPSGGWDGTYKGKPAQQDVYVYIIEFVCDNGQIVPFKGNVMLIR